jgi:hypothetical protein
VARRVLPALGAVAAGARSLRAELLERFEKAAARVVALEPGHQYVDGRAAAIVADLRAGRPVVVHRFELPRHLAVELRDKRRGMYRLDVDGRLAPVVARKVGVDIVGWDEVTA